eukprot:Hpha_TRINITY_DN15781_c1_g1::TRINITY_DN15781_c1_g1_i8::g.40775::m.40775
MVAQMSVPTPLPIGSVCNVWITGRRGAEQREGGDPLAYAPNPCRAIPPCGRVIYTRFPYIPQLPVTASCEPQSRTTLKSSLDTQPTTSPLLFRMSKVSSQEGQGVQQK